MVSPTTFTTSGQRSHHFVPSYSTNNGTATLHPVIADLSIRHIIIFKFYGSIGHKSNACIILVPNFLPPSIRRNVNQFNALYVDESTGTSI